MVPRLPNSAFRAAALYKTWHGGSWGRERLRRPGCAPGAASCGELKAQIAKQPICQTRTLEGKTGAPIGPRRAVERSVSAEARVLRARNPRARFTGCPTCKAKAARRAGGALGGRGIARAPRDRSTGSTAHAIQRRQVGSSHKPALARDDRTRDDRTTGCPQLPGHRTTTGPAPQRGPAPRARVRVLEPQLQSTL